MDRRAHSRQPLLLDAVISAAGMPSRPGKIRNFCVGGLFLACDVAHQPVLTEGAALIIDFTLPVEGRDTPMRLTARVVRVLEFGFGVSLTNPDPATLKALQGYVGRDRGRSDDADVAPSDGAEIQHILSACRQIVAQRLPPQFGAFFDWADKRLLEAADQADNNAEQASYFDAMNELKTFRTPLETTFNERVLGRLENLRNPEAAPDPMSDTEIKSELSLIGDDEFDSFLAVADIISKAEPRYKQQLFGLDQRFSKLAGWTIDHENNPVGPAAIGHAFEESVNSLGAKGKARRVLYRSFEDAVMSNLQELYTELNATLREHGVLPDLETTVARPVRMPSSRPRPPASPAAPPEDHATDTGSAAAADVVPRAAPVAHAGGAEWQRSGAPPYPPQHGPGATGYDASQGILEDAFRAAASMLNLQRGLATGSGAWGSAATGSQPVQTGAPVASPVEFMQALSQLQRENVARPYEDLRRSDLRSLVMEQLRAGGTGAATKQLDAPHNDAISVIDDFVNAVLTDSMVTEALKPLIKRLEVPLLKVALNDQGFLSSKAHPARRVVDQLGRLQNSYHTGGDHSSTAFHRAVDPLVERITSGFDQDLNVFSEVNAELDGLLRQREQDYAENVRKVVQACEQQERFIKQRQSAQGTQPQTSTREVPEELREWLNRGKRLDIGDILELAYRSRDPERVGLAWIGEDKNNYVFVDGEGEKAVSLSPQELAMHLRRGTAEVHDKQDLSTVDRGLFAMLSKMQDELKEQATRDSTTGLVKRKEFEAAVERALKNSLQERTTHVLWLLHLDHFETINTACGEDAGDALLKAVAELLRDRMRDAGIVGRLGGTKFGALMERAAQSNGVEIAERQLQAIKDFTFEWAGESFEVAASVGLVMIDHESEGLSSILQDANVACAEAKADGSNNLRIHQPRESAIEIRDERAEWEGRITKAVEENLLRLRCQRIQPISGDASIKPHYEILLGVEDEDGRPIPPQDFVTAAERYDQMTRVDRWVIKTAFRWMVDNRKKLATLGGCAINLSGHSLSDDSLLKFVLAEFSETMLPPGKVLFEVTETSAIDRLSTAEDFIRVMKEYGCRFSLDDFGTGHSSHAYLKNLPVDYVKIDGMFIRELATNPSDYAVVKSMNDLGHVMGKKTVAEFVENDAILERLKEIGVDYAQGYGIEKPLYLDELV